VLTAWQSGGTINPNKINSKFSLSSSKGRWEFLLNENQDKSKEFFYSLHRVQTRALDANNVFSVALPTQVYCTFSIHFSLLLAPSNTQH